MRKRIGLIFVLVVFGIGFLTRFYKLGVFPDVFNLDEAAIGYNAFTIMEEGVDEFGVSYPTTFRSFGDFKMPLYIYLTSFSFRLFGVGELGVRFFSALAGFLTVVITYFLVKEVGGRRAGLIASLLLAIAPFHIFYSRFGFEANLSLFLVISGIYFLLIGLRKNYLFLLSGLLLVSSLFCYFSPYFFVLPFVFYIMVVKFKEVKKVKGVYLALFFILLIGGFIIALKGTILANSAKTNITIFKDQNIWEEMAQSRAEHEGKGDDLAMFFDNKYVFYGGEFVKNYLDSFNSNFLFFEGGEHPWHRVPQIGNLYFVDFFILGFGIYYLIKKKKWMFLGLFLFSPIASAVTRDAPHTTRLLFFMYFWVVVVGFGVSYLLEVFKKKRWLGYGLVAIYGYLFMFFIQTYWVHFPNNYESLWRYGVKDAASEVVSLYDEVENVYIDDEADYIYYLFFNEYPVGDYLETVKYDVDGQGFVHVKKFGKYKFGKVELGYGGGDSLVVLKKELEDESIELVKKITDRSGRIVYFVGRL